MEVSSSTNTAILRNPESQQPQRPVSQPEQSSAPQQTQPSAAAQPSERVGSIINTTA